MRTGGRHIRGWAACQSATAAKGGVTKGGVGAHRKTGSRPRAVGGGLCRAIEPSGCLLPLRHGSHRGPVAYSNADAQSRDNHQPAVTPPLRQSCVGASHHRCRCVTFLLRVILLLLDPTRCPAIVARVCNIAATESSYKMAERQPRAGAFPPSSRSLSQHRSLEDSFHAEDAFHPRGAPCFWPHVHGIATCIPDSSKWTAYDPGSERDAMA